MWYLVLVLHVDYVWSERPPCRKKGGSQRLLDRGPIGRKLILHTASLFATIQTAGQRVLSELYLKDVRAANHVSCAPANGQKEKPT